TVPVWGAAHRRHPLAATRRTSNRRGRGGGPRVLSDAGVALRHSVVRVQDPWPIRIAALRGTVSSHCRAVRDGSAGRVSTVAVDAPGDVALHAAAGVAGT